MILLYQHPVSPFCIAVEAILKYAKAEYRSVSLPYSDRRLIVEKSRGEYYKVPLLEDEGTAVWDRTELGQEIARHLDGKFDLGLFPAGKEGIQSILSRYIESDLEGVGFKLNDIDYEWWLTDPYDRAMFLRHKERKFGAGCIGEWRDRKAELQHQLKELLAPLDQILSQQPFLIGDRPRFVDFDLFGVLGNTTFSGKNDLPASLGHLRRWHSEMARYRPV
jgi:glutathione S-transferase